jgi:hypothetical protein
MTIEMDAAAAARTLDELAARAAADIRNGLVIELPITELREVDAKAMPFLGGMSRQAAERGFAADFTRCVSRSLEDDLDDDETISKRFDSFVHRLGEAFPRSVHLQGAPHAQ